MRYGDGLGCAARGLGKKKQQHDVRRLWRNCLCHRCLLIIERNSFQKPKAQGRLISDANPCAHVNFDGCFDLSCISCLPAV